MTETLTDNDQVEKANTRAGEIFSDLKRLDYDPKKAGYISIADKLLDELIVVLDATGREWRTGR